MDAAVTTMLFVSNSHRQLRDDDDGDDYDDCFTLYVLILYLCQPIVGSITFLTTTDYKRHKKPLRSSQGTKNGWLLLLTLRER